jgi:hypothetical protein
MRVIVPVKQIGGALPPIKMPRENLLTRLTASAVFTSPARFMAKPR